MIKNKGKVLNSSVGIMKFSPYVFIGLMFSSWILIFSPEIVPFWDYPPHLARLHILKLNGSDPIISQFFSINWHYVPNLALDLFAYPLLQFISADTAMRIFICTGMLIGASGTIYLHRVLGGKGLWPYVVFLTLFNDILAFGFLSYIFTNGLVVWFFAFWLQSRHRGFWFKLAIFTPVTFILLTFHLFGFCTYALLIGSYEIAAFLERYKAKEKLFDDNFIAGALQFLPSFVIFFLASQTASNATFTAGKLMDKLSGLASIFSLYSIELQAVIFLLIALCISATFYLRKSIFAPRMYMFFLLCTFLFIIAPGDAFGSYFLDRRMPIAFLFPIIASIQFKENIIKPVYGWVLLVTLGLSHHIYIGYKWNTFDKIYNDMFEITAELKEGDHLLHLALETYSFSDNFEPPLIRFPEYLLVRKGVISPHVFADIRHQPISYHGPSPEEETFFPSVTSTDIERNILIKEKIDTQIPNKFDYVLLTYFDEEYLSMSTKWQLKSKKGIFMLYEKKE